MEDRTYEYHICWGRYTLIISLRKTTSTTTLHGCNMCNKLVIAVLPRSAKTIVQSYHKLVSRLLQPLLYKPVTTLSNHCYCHKPVTTLLHDCKQCCYKLVTPLSCLSVTSIRTLFLSTYMGRRLQFSALLTRFSTA